MGNSDATGRKAVGKFLLMVPASFHVGILPGYAGLPALINVLGVLQSIHDRLPGCRRLRLANARLMEFLGINFGGLE